MSPSFVDKVRASGPVTERRHIEVIGFDPDVSILGWAMVSAYIAGGLPIEYHSVWLSIATYQGLTGKKAKKGKHQAYDVAKGLTHSPVLVDLMNNHPEAVMVVESQDFYPNQEDTRAKMVATANSLVMISHVSGAAHALAVSRGLETRVVQPSQWKANRSKPVDHERSIRALGSAHVYCEGESGPSATMPAYDMRNLPSKWEHALDGLGMALYGIEQMHRGMWT